MIDFEDLLLLMAGTHRGAPVHCRRDPRALPPFRRRRVPGRQSFAAAVVEAWLGRASSLCVVGIRSRRSTPSPVPRRATCDFRPLPDREVVRLVRNYRSTPEVVGLANARRSRAAGGPGRAASRRPPTGRSPTWLIAEDEAQEAAAVAPASRRSSPPAPRPARSPCSSASTPSRRPTSRPSPPPGCPTSSRRRAVLRAPRGARGGGAAARRGPGRAGRRPRGPGRRRCAGAGKHGWRPDAPPPAPARSGVRALEQRGSAGPPRGASWPSPAPGEAHAGPAPGDFWPSLAERAATSTCPPSRA